MRIDQLLPTFAPHDAIGNHALQIRRALRAAGHESDIWAGAIAPGGRRDARPWDDLVAGPAGRRTLLYHASTDAPITGWLADQAAAGTTVAVDYHNITPSSFFARWLPDAAAGMDLARVQLAELAGVASLAVADSDYNRAELDALGYSPTATCHLLVDLSAYHATPDPRVLARRRRLRAGGGADWLFVGRLAPNKCQHDVIAAFALYRAVVDPEARLTLVGGGTAPRYVTALRALVADLGVADAVDLPDSLDFPALLAVWATTDVFVCLSEHEGFCVPILEAMELGVPVVAYAAAAVPETLGDAGVLLTDKDPAVVALEVEALLGDGERRAAAVAAGRARAGLFSLERTSAAMLAALVGAAR